tara:strand:+ start:1590 stop:2915 length:1326 start_codon:yes stop_codon:yes gene_type:complete
MNIDIEKKNKEISVITLKIKSKDYNSNVQKILNDYRKKANIPGFRKGFVPMGMIKKQYEIPVKVDEINKLVQNELSKYISDNKISILGNPIPLEDKSLDWKDQDLDLSFEIAYKPEFKINFKSKKPVTYYEITADDSMVKNQIDSYQNQYGKLITVNQIEDGINIIGNFSSEKISFSKQTNFKTDQLIKSTYKNQFLKSKVGDELTLNPNQIFNQDNDTNKIIGLDEKGLDELETINFKISELNRNEKAKADKDFFKKIYPKESFKNLKEFKNRVKSDIEKQFTNQSDQKFLNDATESIISNTKIKLPKDFLKRLISINSKEEIAIDDLEKEYTNSENGIKYQLIEEKIVENNNIEINPDSIKNFAIKMIKNQLTAYGQNEPDEKELNSILQRILSNQEEVKRISNQIVSEKLLTIYKDKVSKKKQKISYEKYIEIAYNKK